MFEGIENMHEYDECGFNLTCYQSNGQHLEAHDMALRVVRRCGHGLSWSRVEPVMS
jgi:hypothetical protein